MERFFVENPKKLTPEQVLIQSMPKNGYYQMFESNTPYTKGSIVFTYEVNPKTQSTELVLYEKLTNGNTEPLSNKSAWKKVSLFGGGSGGGGLSIFNTKQEAIDAGADFYGITIESKSIQIDSKFLGEQPTG